jgi:hypothetical protein
MPLLLSSVRQQQKQRQGNASLAVSKNQTKPARKSTGGNARVKAAQVCHDHIRCIQYRETPSRSKPSRSRQSRSLRSYYLVDVVLWHLRLQRDVLQVDPQLAPVAALFGSGVGLGCSWVVACGMRETKSGWTEDTSSTDPTDATGPPTVIRIVSSRNTTSKLAARQSRGGFKKSGSCGAANLGRLSASQAGPTAAALVSS